MNDETSDVTQGGGADRTASKETIVDAVADKQTPLPGPSLAIGEDGLIMPPWIGLVLALLAGLTVWGTLELILPVFQLPEHLRELSGNIPDSEQQAVSAAIKVTTQRNAILALVLLASTLALVLSVTELLHRRAGARIVWGGLLAALVAGVVTLGAGFVAVELHETLRLQENRLGKTIIVQAAMLGITGLAIGLAIAIPVFRIRLLPTCLIGCLVGGLLAALIFPIAASLCLPDVNTDALVPQPGVGRLLWAGLATGLMGLAAAGLGGKKQ